MRESSRTTVGMEGGGPSCVGAELPLNCVPKPGSCDLLVLLILIVAGLIDALIRGRLQRPA